MNKTRLIAQAGIIAAVYGATSVAVLLLPGYLGWGPIQFRVSEALTVIALFTPAAVPGLAVGTAIANATLLSQVGAAGLLDVFFGSIATFLGAVWTWRFRDRVYWALLGPVVANALIIPAYLPLLFRALGIEQAPFLGIDANSGMYLVYGLGVLTVGFGQAVVVYGLGLPLVGMFRRHAAALMWYEDTARTDEAV